MARTALLPENSRWNPATHRRSCDGAEAQEPQRCVLRSLTTLDRGTQGPHPGKAACSHVPPAAATVHRAPVQIPRPRTALVTGTELRPATPAQSLLGKAGCTVLHTAQQALSSVLGRFLQRDHQPKPVACCSAGAREDLFAQKPKLPPLDCSLQVHGVTPRVSANSRRAARCGLGSHVHLTSGQTARTHHTQLAPLWSRGAALRAKSWVWAAGQGTCPWRLAWP